MKKKILFLSGLCLFAALILMMAALPAPVAASPAGFTPTPTDPGNIYPPPPPPPPNVEKTPGGSVVLPVTGDLPPGSQGPAGGWLSLALPAVGVLLAAGAAGLALGLKGGDKLRK